MVLRAPIKNGDNSFEDNIFEFCFALLTSMKIGIDACTWNNYRGFGRFTRELLESIFANDKDNEYLFFVDTDSDEYKELPPNVKKIVICTKNLSMKSASASGRRSLRDLWAMSREVWQHQVDIFFFPAVYSYYPIFNKTKVILTIHDVIADHYPKLIFPDLKLKLFWKLKQNLAIFQADLILTVSEYSKREIIDFFKLPESKVQVISEAARSVFNNDVSSKNIDSSFSIYNLKPSDKFLLYVGGISPHKNLNNLISAFQQIIAERNASNIKLVLVGDYQDDPFFSAYPSLKEKVEEYGLSDKVIFTGYIPDLNLAKLYNAATLVVMPSLEEGFGLPAIEAMACGTPVAASNRGSLPEVLGNAGRFFDPLNIMNMAYVIGEIFDSEFIKTQMSQSGLLRAQEFMWNRSAKQMLTIFEDLVNK